MTKISIMLFSGVVYLFAFIPHVIYPLVHNYLIMTTVSMILLSVMVCLIALIPHVIYFLAWMLGKCCRGNVKYAPFGWCALALALIVTVGFCYGNMAGRWQTKQEPVELSFDNLPKSFDGYKIVHISDFHLASFIGHEDMLQRVVDEINAIDADIVCFTGDLVTFSASEVSQFTHILKNIKAKDGVVSVLGNHDYYPSDTAMTNAQRGLGWRMLNNENMVVKRGSEKIHILGVKNEHSSGDEDNPVKYCDLEAAKKGVKGFCVLLTHNPAHWRAEVVGKEDIPLTLSGHTHAAQLKLFEMTPASWMFTDAEGLCTEQKQHLYVNTGLGCTLPVRIGVPQEITVITLKNG